ncbi:S41 family peptidase [Phocaeicola sp.]|uniref:S41 family peptidase n=1 Tax=Phocaeicola sp. TaxID=2773926 RepID=UPI0023C40730|nr:S41 family peptidase [Phocaeicola sp.]MDE5677182.1 peptidase S41 [Phocaeicola sp.]
MKQIYDLRLFLFLSVVILLFTSCSDHDNNNELLPGVTYTNWTEGAPLEMDKSNTLTIHFNAAAPWTASVASGTDWCILSPTSGSKGQSSFTITANTEATTQRTAKIIIRIDGYQSTSLEVTQKPEGDREVNEKVDKYLSSMYLWNDEYKTLKLDYNKDYDAFFYDALGSMTTNTLDNKPYTGNDGKTYHSLFSYITKKNPARSALSYPLQEKEKEYSFGIIGMTVVIIDSYGHYAFCIQGVYPDSPASHAEIKRGTLISEINGNKITKDNYIDLYWDLLYPESPIALNIKELTFTENLTDGMKEYTMTAEAIYKNPVIYQDIIEKEGAKRIGYLVYTEFDAGYDDTLFEVFKNFKSRNITDLILDLRYNGGGHVISSNFIASCIAGSAYQDAVFIKYRYNKERMQKQNNKKSEEKSVYSFYQNLNTSLSACDLSLRRIYCLVGRATASASELLINTLLGIDIDVILIGENTTGKNVGMEPEEISVDETTYEVYPITFQTYNAKDNGDYENGFIPNILMNENDINNDGYFDKYIEFGHPDEPLLSRAIQEITGQASPRTRSAASKGFKSYAIETPHIFRPGYQSMIKSVYDTDIER